MSAPYVQICQQMCNHVSRVSDLGGRYIRMKMNTGQTRDASETLLFKKSLGFRLLGLDPDREIDAVKIMAEDLPPSVLSDFIVGTPEMMNVTIQRYILRNKEEFFSRKITRVNIVLDEFHEFLDPESKRFSQLGAFLSLVYHLKAELAGRVDVRIVCMTGAFTVLHEHVRGKLEHLFQDFIVNNEIKTPVNATPISRFSSDSEFNTILRVAKERLASMAPEMETLHGGLLAAAMQIVKRSKGTDTSGAFIVMCNKLDRMHLVMLILLYFLKYITVKRGIMIREYFGGDTSSMNRLENDVKSLKFNSATKLKDKITLTTYRVMNDRNIETEHVVEDYSSMLRLMFMVGARYCSAHTMNENIVLRGYTQGGEIPPVLVATQKIAVGADLPNIRGVVDIYVQPADLNQDSINQRLGRSNRERVSSFTSVDKRKSIPTGFLQNSPAAQQRIEDIRMRVQQTQPPTSGPVRTIFDEMGFTAQSEITIKGKFMSKIEYIQSANTSKERDLQWYTGSHPQSSAPWETVIKNTEGDQQVLYLKQLCAIFQVTYAKLRPSHMVRLPTVETQSARQFNPRIKAMEEVQKRVYFQNNLVQFTFSFYREDFNLDTREYNEHSIMRMKEWIDVFQRMSGNTEYFALSLETDFADNNNIITTEIDAHEVLVDGVMQATATIRTYINTSEVMNYSRAVFANMDTGSIIAYSYMLLISSGIKPFPYDLHEVRPGYTQETAQFRNRAQGHVTQTHKGTHWDMARFCDQYILLKMFNANVLWFSPRVDYGQPREYPMYQIVFNEMKKENEQTAFIRLWEFMCSQTIHSLKLLLTQKEGKVTSYGFRVFTQTLDEISKLSYTINEMRESKDTNTKELMKNPLICSLMSAGLELDERVDLDKLKGAFGVSKEMEHAIKWFRRDTDINVYETRLVQTILEPSEET
jgi:hypothetical protein